jgi:hypothetical protein
VVALWQVRRTASNVGMDVRCGLQVAVEFMEVRRLGGVPGEGGVERGQGRQSRMGPPACPTATARLRRTIGLVGLGGRLMCCAAQRAYRT